MNLKAVLDDKTAFPDTLEFAVGNEKVTLGELRSAREQMETEAKNKMKAADDKFAEVTNLATVAADLKSKLETQLAEAGKGKTPPTEDEFDSDPFWQPVNKRVKGINDTVNALQDTIKKLGTAIERSATIWAEDRWQNQFDRLKPRLAKSKEHKDWDYVKVRDYAATNKILDRHGLPSVEKAIEQLTANADIEERLEAARLEGEKRGEMRARMAASGRPTSATGPKKPEKTAVAEHGLEGLGDDVANDPDLTQMLADLGAADPSQFGQA